MGGCIGLIEGINAIFILNYMLVSVNGFSEEFCQVSPSLWFAMTGLIGVAQSNKK